jgi:hypothetical protein
MMQCDVDRSVCHVGFVLLVWRVCNGYDAIDVIRSLVVSSEVSFSALLRGLGLPFDVSCAIKSTFEAMRLLTNSRVPVEERRDSVAFHSLIKFSQSTTNTFKRKAERG